MTSAYCGKCGAEREVRITQRRETYTVKGEPTDVESNVAVCVECGEDVFVKELDERNLKRAFDGYRRAHDLLTAADIKLLRDRYGLTQRALGQLLGWGQVTVNRYENGAIQTEGHNRMLKLLEEPRNVRRVLDDSRDALSDRVREELEARLDGLERSHGDHSISECLAAFLDSGKPSLMNGYRRFDLVRAHQATAFLAKNVMHFFESKATKLLWYADFLAFRSQACSITGCSYEAASYGPVPRRFNLLFAEMVTSEVLMAEEIPFESGDGTGFVGKLYRPGTDPGMNALSGLEVKCLAAVSREFENLSASRTVDRAHKEDAYLAVFEVGKSWKLIPYDLAETLTLDAIK